MSNAIKDIYEEIDVLEQGLTFASSNEERYRIYSEMEELKDCILMYTKNEWP